MRKRGLLDYIYVNDVANLKRGKGLYTTILDEDGNIFDDWSFFMWLFKYPFVFESGWTLSLGESPSYFMQLLKYYLMKSEIPPEFGFWCL